MKFYLISDNRDTQIGMRLVGIEGEVVHDRTQFLMTLTEKMKDPSIAIILMTSKLVAMCPDTIAAIKLKQHQPLLVEIPDRHGGSQIGDRMEQYIADAIGR